MTRKRSRPDLRSLPEQGGWTRPLALLALFAVAAAWRFAYLVRLDATPLRSSLDADARIYWTWSEFIHRHGAIPPAPFFLAPLYPYFIAAVRAVTGGTPASVLAVQALMGAAAVALLADATSRVAGKRAALIVGIVLALFQSSTFFDGLLLPESLLLFVESLLIRLIAGTDWPEAGLGRFLSYGALVGVLAEGRASNAALLVLLVPLVRAQRTGVAHRARSAAAAIAAFALCCAPAMVANLRASGEPIPFTYNLGFNLYVGNNPEADGRFVDVTAGSLPVPLEGTPATTGGALDGRAFVLATERRRLTPAQSSSYWARKAAEHVRAAPMSALRLAGKKLLLAWNRRTTPQIESLEAYARTAGPLGLPLAGSFACLAVLGLSGLAIARGRGVIERWLTGYLALTSLTMAAFFVTDRYRYHLVPALAVFAGVAIAEAPRVARAGTPRARAAAGCASAIALGIVLAPVGARDPRLAAWGIAADEAMRLGDLGSADEAAHEFAVAESMLAGVQPDSIATSARTAVASFYLHYGAALESLGRSPDAIARWERAVEFNPNDAASLGRLAQADAEAGRTADASRARDRLSSVPGGRGILLVDDAWATAARGDLAGAEALFLDAVRVQPDLSTAWEGLIRVRIQTARYDEAARTLDDARAAGLDPTSGDIYESALAAARGDLQAARRSIARARTGPPPRDPILARFLADAQRAAGTEGSHP